MNIILFNCQRYYNRIIYLYYYYDFLYMYFHLIFVVLSKAILAKILQLFYILCTFVDVVYYDEIAYV